MYVRLFETETPETNTMLEMFIHLFGNVVIFFVEANSGKKIGGR